MIELNNNTSESATSDEFKDKWLIRPCLTYKDEYRDCTSFVARFHQYFVFGTIIDCKQWIADYKNCCKWEKNQNKEAYNELIVSEKKRRLIRLKGHYGNNVWEKRDEPPENWNAPLPKWLEERNQNSHLKSLIEAEKTRKESGKYSCVIM